MPARAPTTCRRRCSFFLFPCRPLLLAATISLLSSLPVHADEPQPGISEALELLKEEETVSIAVRHEQPISQAPSNVYVITDEDIRHSGVRDLPTLLRRIPGIEVIQMTQADFNVSVRGDNQLRHNKMLVMVDGRQIYLDAQGEVLWKMLPVTLPEIKRIEVLKGPASVLYGFNAFDGIINIITKSADEMKGATLQVAGGEFGSLLTSGIYAGRSKDFTYRFSAGHEQTNHWDDRNALSFRAYRLNAQTEYDLSPESKVFASAGLVNADHYEGPIVASVLVPQQKPAIGYVYSGYERPNFFIRGWWYYLDQPFKIQSSPLIPIQNIIPLDQRILGNSWNLEAQHSLDVGTHRITYGINYRHNSFRNTSFDGHALEDRFGLYIQEEWRATPTVTATAGVRLDMDTFINPTYSPRVTLLFRPIENHTFRMSGAIGYRPPTITETRSRAFASFFGGPPGVLKGNPNLAPEQIISYEVGYQGWYYRHRVRVRADLFYNHISDLIDTRLIDPALGIATFTNGANLTIGGGEADIYGGEAGIEVLATKWLSGFSNFTYEEFGQTFKGRAARGMPRFKANAGVRSEFENGVSGEAAVHYYGAATYALDPAFTIPAFLAGNPAPNPRVGSYVLLNLRGAYRFWQQKAAAGYMREAEVAVSVFNALNDRHKEHPLGETIGSLVMGGLTIKY